jgi:phenylpropionate dioxygenase-like ring-hydroxylating dioxygenase large terminal subunit
LTGYLRVESNYQLVLDNLLDLTHASYIHVATVGLKAEEWIGETKMDYEFSVKGGVINSDYVFRNSPPTPLLALFNDMPVGDIYAPMALYPASTLILDMGMTAPGQPKAEGVFMPSAHFIVPETETSCHYFYAISRSTKLNDDGITQAMGKLVRSAFVDEDAPMIQDVQGEMGDAEFFSLRPVLLKGDVAAVQARRILTQLIQKENASGLKVGELEGAARASEEVARVE